MVYLLVMRVIAGEHRGRRLLGPEDDQTTRPITDRVKVALFDRLWAHGWLDEPVVLDLFCGTGSLGIETLSRGAEAVVFVERDREARRRLEENLTTLRLNDRAKVLSGDALSAGLGILAGRRDFSLLFLDPPYVMLTEPADQARVLAQLDRLAEIAAERSLAILRTDKHTTLPPTPVWGEPVAYEYGSMTLWWYQRGS